MNPILNKLIKAYKAQMIFLENDSSYFENIVNDKDLTYVKTNLDCLLVIQMLLLRKDFDHAIQQLDILTINGRIISELAELIKQLKTDDIAYDTNAGIEHNKPIIDSNSTLIQEQYTTIIKELSAQRNSLNELISNDVNRKSSSSGSEDVSNNLLKLNAKVTSIENSITNVDKSINQLTNASLEDNPFTKIIASVNTLKNQLDTINTYPLQNPG